MSSQHVKYVLIGGGGAGSAAAEAIRQLDPTGSILLVGQEHSRPYIRPELSKRYLRREISRSGISTDAVGSYSDQHIEMRTSCRVSNLDTSRQCITLDSGEEISFDKALIAIGASPKVLRVAGADLPNVFYLRTLDDCDRLLHAIDQAKAEGRPHPAPPLSGTVSPTSTGPAPVAAKPRRGRAVVVGGGLLAPEVAASLRQLELHVELVTTRAYPWGKFAGDATGRFITKYLQSRGIIVHATTSIERLEGDGRVQHILTANGATIDCDLVVVAIGITPNRELLRGTPIVAEKAILVDQHGQTSIDGIYAAGDCAAIFDPLFGKHRNLDHWDSARLTGAIAGTNMAGGTAEYQAVNSYSSEVFDITLRVWGESRFVDRTLVRGTPSVDSPDFAEIGIAADGTVSQVLAIGCAAEHAFFEAMVRRRMNVQGKEELLKDPNRSFNL